MAPPRKPRPACAICGKPVKRPTKKFCSRPCRDEAARRSSNAGTFRAGGEAHNHLPVGTITVRQRRRRSEGPRAWIKIAEPNEWKLRAVLVWEQEHGPLPVGQLVHHRNRDTLDDSPDNLEAIDRAGHLAEHRPEFEAKRARAASRARWG
jgi:hypothetical protein